MLKFKFQMYTTSRSPECAGAHDRRVQSTTVFLEKGRLRLPTTMADQSSDEPPVFILGDHEAGAALAEKSVFHLVCLAAVVISSFVCLVRCLRSPARNMCLKID